jgi:hypothetical protein
VQDLIDIDPLNIPSDSSVSLATYPPDTNAYISQEINSTIPRNLLEDMSPSAITNLTNTPSITSINSYFKSTINCYAEQNGANNPKQLIGAALKERVGNIDHDSCEPGDEDTFFVADLGEVYRQHMRWKSNLPRVKPFYGENFVQTILQYADAF